jgi:predicted  nucleic acid-binding Zn-ribbon protein
MSKNIDDLENEIIKLKKLHERKEYEVKELKSQVKRLRDQFHEFEYVLVKEVNGAFAEVRQAIERIEMNFEIDRSYEN